MRNLQDDRRAVRRLLSEYPDHVLAIALAEIRRRINGGIMARNLADAYRPEGVT